MRLAMKKLIIYLGIAGVFTCHLAAQLMPPQTSTPQKDGTTLREPVPEESDETSKKIIAQHLKATGGESKLRNLTGIYLEGHMREGNRNYQVIAWESPRAKIRIEEFSKHLGREQRIIYGFDGTQSWVYDLTTQRPIPKARDHNNVRRILRRNTFYGPFIDAEAQGLKFKYQGRVVSRGKHHHLIKMYHPNGLSEYFYFDTEQFMITRHGWQEIIQDNSVAKDLYFTQYTAVDGIQLPQRIEFALENKTYGAFTIHKYEVNPNIDPRMYTMPDIKQRSLAFGTFVFELSRPDVPQQQEHSPHTQDPMIPAAAIGQQATYFTGNDPIRYVIQPDKAIVFELYKEGQLLPSGPQVIEPHDMIDQLIPHVLQGEYLFKFIAQEVGTTHVTLKIEKGVLEE